MRLSLLLLLPILLLSGCFQDKTDLHEFFDYVKASTPVGIEPIPAVNDFAHIQYEGATYNSPFVKPPSEGIVDKINQNENCLQPDQSRLRHPLENFAMDNLIMKGTMGTKGHLTALIESTVNYSLYQVDVGDYVGLFHGKVTLVAEDRIEFIEMTPDGTGCYKQRASTLALTVPVTSQ